MGVGLTNTTNQYVAWGAHSPVMNLTNRTWLSWITWNSHPSLIGATFTLMPLDAPAEWCGWHDDTSRNAISLFIKWSSQFGVWTIARPSLTDLHMIAFTYNNSSTANNPVIYVDGESVTVTRATAPAGTYVSGTNVNMQLGASDGTNVADATIHSFSIYNRILSAAEILEAYNSRLFIPNRNGLVFCPHLSGAAGLQTFDGATLGAGNKIVDTISGALGTPAGSPVCVADKYLTY